MQIICLIQKCYTHPYLQTEESQYFPAERRRCPSSPGCRLASCSVSEPSSSDHGGVQSGSRSGKMHRIFGENDILKVKWTGPTSTVLTLPSQTRSGTVCPKAPKPVSQSKPCGSPCLLTSYGAAQKKKRFNA